MSLLSLKAWPEDLQAFWKFLLPAVPGIIGALPAYNAVLLRVEPAANRLVREQKCEK